MAKGAIRLIQVIRKSKVSIDTIVGYLNSKGFKVNPDVNTKITEEQFSMVIKEFAPSMMEHIVVSKDKVSEVEVLALKKEAPKAPVPPYSSEPKLDKLEKRAKIAPPKLEGIKIVGKVILPPPPSERKKEKPKEAEKPKETKKPVVDKTPEEKKKPIVPAIKEPIHAKEIEETPPKSIEPLNTETIPLQPKKPQETVIKAKADKSKGLTIIGKMELPKEPPKQKPAPVASSDRSINKVKKKYPRRRIKRDRPGNLSPQRTLNPQEKAGKKAPKPTAKEKPIDKYKQNQERLNASMAFLTRAQKGGGRNRSKYRREKRSAQAEAREEVMLQAQEDAKVLKVSEFISANDLALMMDKNANEIISACMSLGVFVSINQRLDAETIAIIADEFGYKVVFASTEEEVETTKEEDLEEDLINRPPIVTIMGHVDHGKTSLLDFIRNSKVIESEAGGITQHIGAYDVITDSGKRIAFLDTPGHEAFTAMRARGAKVTDVAIIVIAADDAVMDQTKEAINHVQLAEVPMVIAINKIDKPNANPDKIKEGLSRINVLVDGWGGKHQCQEISAKTGEGVEDLLEKVLLEAEVLELKANPNKNAIGTVIEATLDKGRGYVTTVLVQAGTLKIGDVVLAGEYFSKVKAMFDHKGSKLKTAGPSTPVQMLGLDGAPQAGDIFKVMNSEREARDIASKREQIYREQSMRTKKHITLDEIGRRLAIGNFRQLNIIIKGDVDGSVEALAGAMLNLSTNEIKINIIQKGVGQISETDVQLASASDAIIIGFQVRPSSGVKKVAEQEEIDIRLYSVIYDAINELKDAMEGMLAPDIEEIITGNADVRDVFKIAKVGTVAGCMVTNGFFKRGQKVRIIRSGIVTYTSEITALKRFKDDVAEVKKGYECGISIKNYNDIKIGDVIESYENREIKRKL